MRINKPVTQKEVDFPQDHRLISTTTPKGVITHANQHFCDVAGFSHGELCGQAHNIVRHPDMPQAAFKELWDTAAERRNWMGLVKNRCKNGDHYWVDAFVTPICDGDAIKELQSVRKRPKPEHQRRAESLYAKLCEGRLPLSLRMPRTSLATRFTGLFLASQIPFLAGVFSQAALTTLSLLFLLSFGIFIVGGQFLTARLRRLVQESEQVADSPIARHIYTCGNDDVCQLELSIRMRESELDAVTSRMLHSSHSIDEFVEQAQQGGTRVARELEGQKQRSQTVASASYEMSQAIQEVSENTQAMAQGADNAADAVAAGVAQADQCVEAINRLDRTFQRMSDVIGQLDEHSRNIGSILEVVTEVADQTNLLALNAAIEAARAGEHGRGFAVVSDEVRALAVRTQGATEDIRSIVHQLESGMKDVVAQVDEGKSVSQQCVEKNHCAQDSLNEIKAAIQRITGMATSVASTVEEQAVASNEIAESIQKVDEAGEAASEQGTELARLNSSLREEFSGLVRLVNRLASRS